MTQSIGTIAQKALRRLGVRIVPLDDSPTLTEFVPAGQIAAEALIELGVLNTDPERATGTVTPTGIATAALVELGVLNSDDALAPLATVPAADIVTTALVGLGVLNSGDPSSSDPTIPMDDIAGAALVELGVIAADEAPSSPDLLLATEKVVSVHDGLQARGITRWSNAAIPASVSEEYIKLTAAMVSSSFGKTVDPAIVTMLEGRIRSAATVLTMSPTQMMGHLEGVHESLVARGIAQWNIGAIPAAFAEEYSKLTVAYVNATFGRPETDPAIVAALEGRIRMGAMVLNNDTAFMVGHVTAVHGSLAAKGIASWGLYSIPGAFAEEYTKLVSLYAAASFGKPADLSAVGALEDHIRAGATVLNNNQAFMLDKVASVHAALDAQGVVWWSGDAIPRAFVVEYTKLTVAAAASSFGQQSDPKMVLLLEARVRKGAMTLSSDDIANQHVQAVHDDLAMRGIVHWSSFDIPDAVGDAYSWLAAGRMAPLFEAQTDPRDAQAAMVAIYRYVTLPTSGETTPAVYF